MYRKIFVFAAMMLTLIFSAAAFAAYERTASVTIPAYTDPELRNRNGNERVDAGDRLIVFEERGTAYFVRYPTSNGTKDRWVSKGVFTETIGDGWYRIKPMHDLGHSADALGHQYGSGNNIHLWENIDCDQQKFYLQNRGNGYFSLQSGYGNRLFVTADGSGNGANLYTSNWNGSDSQLFRLVSGGNNSFHIFSKAGNAMNFDCAGAGSGNGTNLQLWNSENVNWQKWTLERVNGPSSPTPALQGDVRTRLLNTIFGRSGGRISCDFDSYVNTPGRHEGIDMVLHDGAEIHAITSGVVTKAGGDRINTVAIYDSANNKTVVYLHMGAVHVREGQQVSKGTVIGTQGSVGASSSHIHLEVRDGQRRAAAKSVNDSTLDNSNPYSYLEKVL